MSATAIGDFLATFGFELLAEHLTNVDTPAEAIE
jgi:hypothetical protein